MPASAKRAVCEIVGGVDFLSAQAQTLMFSTCRRVGGVGLHIRVLGYSIESIKASFVSFFISSGSDSNTCFLCSLLMPLNA